MVKIKKRYLLIAIVTVVAMLCCGLSLILSANTNGSGSTSVDMTVKADEYWSEWTTVGEGDFGAFHYEAKSGSDGDQQCIIFTGLGALDLTHCEVNWTGNSCTVTTSEDNCYWCCDLVVGEGITSVTLILNDQATCRKIDLSSTVVSIFCKAKSPFSSVLTVITEPS